MTREQSYSIKEYLEEKFEEVSRRFDSQDKKLSYTNGKVRLLEKFMWGLGGAIAVIGYVLGSPLLSNIKIVSTSEQASSYQSYITDN